MSHFPVLVALKEFTEQSLEEALQPFHEYECTGVKDKYVVFVEVEESVEELKEFYEGEHKEKFSSFDQFLTEYFGYELDGEGNVGRWTNPNKKWDHWTIGGRWSGHLVSKKGERVDIALKSDVDFDLMKKLYLDEVMPLFKEAKEALNGETFTTWKQLLEIEMPPEERREKYRNQPAIKKLRETFNNPFLNFDKYMLSEDDFKTEHEFQAISTFAILHDGKWHGKGDMGWWGVVLDENDNWREIFTDTLSKIQEDYTLVVVDCHI